MKSSVRVISLVAFLMLFAAYAMPAIAQQQTVTVSGTVLDPDGKPLNGATVAVYNGTQ